MKRTILGIVIAVLAFGGYTAFDYLTGNELGGPCQHNGDCKGTVYGKFGNQCLDLGTGVGFCTETCGGPADCTPPMTCQEFAYEENGVQKGTNRVCAPPDPSQVPPPGAAPAAPVAPPAPAR